MTGVTIRPATHADQAFLRDMLSEALFVPPGSPPFPRSALDSPHLGSYVAGFGTQRGDIGFIAEINDTPIAAIWARLPTESHRTYGYVDDATPELSMAVAPVHRGEGIGTALLEQLIDLCPRLSLSVDARNPAVRLYERAGFVAVEDDGNSVTMLRHG
jgi:GNAT superfamily N-acetyltransferase